MRQSCTILLVAAAGLGRRPARRTLRWLSPGKRHAPRLAPTRLAHVGRICIGRPHRSAPMLLIATAGFGRWQARRALCSRTQRVPSPVAVRRGSVRSTPLTRRTSSRPLGAPLLPVSTRPSSTPGTEPNATPLSPRHFHRRALPSPTDRLGPLRCFSHALCSSVVRGGQPPRPSGALPRAALCT